MGKLHVTLDFAGPVVELISTTVYCVDTKTRRVSVRGKTSGAYRDAGTFQWTSAVRGLASLLIKTVRGVENPCVEPVILGHAGSLAASMDYALSKGPRWIGEMFGWDSRGEALAKRLFVRTNRERKRPGPVTVSVNTRWLSPQDILIRLDGLPVGPAELGDLHDLISGAQSVLVEELPEPQAA